MKARERLEAFRRRLSHDRSHTSLEILELLKGLDGGPEETLTIVIELVSPDAEVQPLGRKLTYSGNQASEAAELPELSPELARLLSAPVWQLRRIRVALASWLKTVKFDPGCRVEIWELEYAETAKAQDKTTGP